MFLRNFENLQNAFENKNDCILHQKFSDGEVKKRDGIDLWISKKKESFYKTFGGNVLFDSLEDKRKQQLGEIAKKNLDYYNKSSKPFKLEITDPDLNEQTIKACSFCL